MKRMNSHAVAAAVVLALGCTAAHAGVMDFLFGKKSASTEASSTQGQADSKRRSWRISEFTAISLVQREAGSTPNEHPVTLQPEGLRQQLSLVRAQIGGKPEALFHPDELKDLVEPLAQALSVAKPDDDIVLLSTSRRGEGLLSTPLGVTARIFVKDGNLNVVVRDVRRDFVNAYRGTHIEPQFEFGARGKQSAAVLQGPSGAGKRADWIQMPIAGAATAAAPIAPVAPAPLRAVNSVTPAAAIPVAPAAVVAPVAPSRDDAFYAEQARRLKGLKLLRDQGAISEEEYQQKRKEILSTL